MLKRGFTLIEVIVVIGIIAIMTSFAAIGYSSFVKQAQRTRGIETIHQVKTALESVYMSEGYWPVALLKTGASGRGILDQNVGAALASRQKMSLMYVSFDDDGDGEPDRYQLSGHDRFGVLDPWGFDALKSHGASAQLSTKVPSGGTISDHILRYAIDDDDDGITKVSHGYDGSDCRVRAPCCVWSCGPDGVFGSDKNPSAGKDDLRSWSEGQEIGK